MRRGDGLCALAAAHQQAQLAPSNGGDRPRIVVTVRHDQLRDDCVVAGVLDSGERLTAGQLRLLACDAEVLPAVLGGNSEILDVGRAQRLVTPPIRTALALRDRGCVFPGCDAPASVCHAHHLVPWWADGATSLSDLVLLCPHHHGLVEPSRDGPPGQRRGSPTWRRWGSRGASPCPDGWDSKTSKTPTLRHPTPPRPLSLNPPILADCSSPSGCTGFVGHDQQTPSLSSCATSCHCTRLVPLATATIGGFRLNGKGVAPWP